MRMAREYDEGGKYHFAYGLHHFGRVFRRVVGYVEGKDAVALPSQGGYNCPSYHYGDTENDVAEDGMDD